MFEGFVPFASLNTNKVNDLTHAKVICQKILFVSVKWWSEVTKIINQIFWIELLVNFSYLIAYDYLYDIFNPSIFDVWPFHELQGFVFRLNSSYAHWVNEPLFSDLNVAWTEIFL